MIHTRDMDKVHTNYSEIEQSVDLKGQHVLCSAFIAMAIFLQTYAQINCFIAIVKKNLGSCKK
jgi:hypothetical protein